MLPGWAIGLIVLASVGVTGGMAWLAHRFVAYRRLYNHYSRLVLTDRDNEAHAATLAAAAFQPDDSTD